MDLFTNIFSSSGHVVSETVNDDLIVEKNGKTTYIRMGDVTDLQQIRELANSSLDGTKLYVTTEELDPQLHQLATELGVLLWDNDILEQKIGKAVIADLKGVTEELELIDDIKQTEETEHTYLTAGYFIPPSREEPERKRMGWPDFSLNEPATTQTREQENTPDQEEPVLFETFVQPDNSTPREDNITPQEEQLLTEEHQPLTLEIPCAPLMVSKEKALSIAMTEIGKPEKANLKFIPFWSYAYRVYTQQRFKNKLINISGEERGSINALNGNEDNMNIDSIEHSITIFEDYDVKARSVDEQEAHDILINNIKKKYTRDVRFDNMVGETIISEHKQVMPEDKDIDLNLTMVYVPIWEVGGKRKSVEINGHTAQILEEPLDDDVEFI